MSKTADDQSLILNAAKACYLRLGVAKTTAADIASEAGISRATLYRRFPSHEDIFVRVLARDSMDMVQDSNARLGNITDPGERIIEGMLFCLDEIPRRPLHAHLLQESGAITLAMPAETLHAIALGMLSDLLHVSPAVADQGIDDFAELLLRILASYAMVPSHRARNRDEMRRFLHNMLDPIIASVLAGHGTDAKNKKTKGNKRGGKPT